MKSRTAARVITAVCACGMMNAQARPSLPGPTPIPQYSFHLSDNQILPIGEPGATVSGIFGCGDDGSLYLQVIHPPIPGSGEIGDIALYAVRGTTDVVRFRSELAQGYRRISPITRYFAGDSKVVALAYGIGVSHGDMDTAPDPQHILSVLMVFDRKDGSLLWSRALDPDLHPEQLGMFPSGQILLVTWNSSLRQSRLLVLNSQGSEEREIPLQYDDPAAASSSLPLTELEVRPYGENLMLVPEDTSGTLLEVSETGVVNTYRLKIPAEYSSGLPIYLSPRGFLFRMIVEPAEHPDAGRSGPDNSAAPKMGLGALQSTPGPVMQFDPTDGRVVRQYNFAALGFQPACVKDNGDFLFLGTRASDGRLELVTATPQSE